MSDLRPPFITKLINTTHNSANTCNWSHDVFLTCLCDRFVCMSWELCKDRQHRDWEAQCLSFVKLLQKCWDGSRTVQAQCLHSYCCSCWCGYWQCSHWIHDIRKHKQDIPLAWGLFRSIWIIYDLISMARSGCATIVVTTFVQKTFTNLKTLSDVNLTFRELSFGMLACTARSSWT